MTQNAAEYLRAVASEAREAIEAGIKPNPKPLTVRELLALFGYARRGSGVVAEIRNALEEHGLRTNPDFESIWIDSEALLELDRGSANGSVETLTLDDPTVRVDAIAAAHRPPTVVDPDSPLEAATTLMLLNDYSQLPVTKNSRKIQGVISWKSIGSRLASGIERPCVRQCMNTEVKEVRLTTPLLDAVADVSSYGYTLVRGRDDGISGIVTTSDLSEAFLELANPFLLVGEIERYLYFLVHGRFNREELQAVLPDRTSLSGTADLTLGGYCRLLAHSDNWLRIDLRFSREEFMKRLEKVRVIRNHIMHFRPDGLDPNDLQDLQGLVGFFRHLARMGVIESRSRS